MRRTLICLLCLAGCAEKPLAPIDPVPVPDPGTLATCCASQDHWPLAVVEMAEATSLWIVPATRAVKLRPSYLEDQTGAQDHLIDQAQVLDLILMSNHSRLSGAGGDGFFGHSALFLGGEGEMRALGLWDHPAVTPHHAMLRQGSVAIEALDEGVHLSHRSDLLEADAAALFRLERVSTARKRAVVLHLLAQLGRPFDQSFRLDNGAPLYCTELIHDALPEARFPQRESYGRAVIWPDEIASQSLLGTTGFRFVTYVEGGDGGWRTGSADLMASRILAAWPADGD